MRSLRSPNLIFLNRPIKKMFFDVSFCDICFLCGYLLFVWHLNTHESNFYFAVIENISLLSFNCEKCVIILFVQKFPAVQKKNKLINYTDTDYGLAILNHQKLAVQCLIFFTLQIGKIKDKIALQISTDPITNSAIDMKIYL